MPGHPGVRRRPPVTGMPRSPIQENIETVRKLEQEFLHGRSVSERLADGVGGFAGSLRFVVIHVVWISCYLVWNLGAIPEVKPFDPYPFMLLALILSGEAIFLSTFVLMKQNRMSKRADQRAHLDLQVNLLTEREITAVLQIVEQISARLEIPQPHEDLKDLREETSVQALADELKDKLPED